MADRELLKQEFRKRVQAGEDFHATRKAMDIPGDWAMTWADEWAAEENQMRSVFSIQTDPLAMSALTHLEDIMENAAEDETRYKAAAKLIDIKLKIFGLDIKERKVKADGKLSETIQGWKFKDPSA